jgi:ABC-2 type transport system ATP-binding protein
VRIDVENLVLRYGDVTALDGLTFRLEAGKIYGLLGRNGAGKTSLLSVLAAFRRQSAGRCASTSSRCSRTRASPAESA